MVRMMRAPAPSRRSMTAMGTPAATEMTSLRGSTTGATWTSTLSSTCGLTESTTTSASRTAATLSRLVRTP
jgi:hypothetical protein